LLPYFGNDFLASVVVFIVALPLCMGIAIASGVDPAKGILTGVVGGLVVSILGGSQLQVSGPAAGLAVLMLELIREHGIEKAGCDHSARRSDSDIGWSMSLCSVVQSRSTGGYSWHVIWHWSAHISRSVSCHG
jgi:MFS superfamily sulfate permease-like transporter